MMDRDTLVRQLVLHEGERLKPYPDTDGKITIGIGRNLTDKGISSSESRILCDHDIDEAVQDLTTFAWFPTLDPVRQRVVLDMRFNLGPNRFRGFRQMIHALAIGDDAGAAREMLASQWAKQVKGRADRLARMMTTGCDEVN